MATFTSSLSTTQLAEYVRRQLAATFPDDGALDDVPRVVARALERLEVCLTRSGYGLHWKGDVCAFHHLKADQYVCFLYYASHVAYQDAANGELASKLFYLNKALHGFHCMYDTVLPETFVVVHGVGIVLGKATYANGFVVMQNCTVGANFDHQPPVLGERVVMYPGSSVIGRTTVGADSCIANGAFVNDADIPPGSLVIGKSPSLVLKPNRPDRLKRFYPLPG